MLSLGCRSAGQTTFLHAIGRRRRRHKLPVHLVCLTLHFQNSHLFPERLAEQMSCPESWSVRIGGCRVCVQYTAGSLLFLPENWTSAVWRSRVVQHPLRVNWRVSGGGDSRSCRNAPRNAVDRCRSALVLLHVTSRTYLLKQRH